MAEPSGTNIDLAARAPAARWASEARRRGALGPGPDGDTWAGWGLPVGGPTAENSKSESTGHALLL